MIKNLLIKIRKLIQFNRNHNFNTTSLGKKGEALAIQFLKNEKKYKIIASNWTHKKDEIDIIAKDGDVLVFVEVKTRSKETPLMAHYYSVTTKKKKNLARGCKSYLKYTKPTPKHFRFDIILVKFCKNKENIIQHYSNIKLFSKYFQPLSYD